MEEGFAPGHWRFLKSFTGDCAVLPGLRCIRVGPQKEHKNGDKRIATHCSDFRIQKSLWILKEGLNFFPGFMESIPFLHHTGKLECFQKAKEDLGGHKEASDFFPAGVSPKCTCLPLSDIFVSLQWLGHKS